MVIPRNYSNTAGGTLGAANSLSALDLEFHYGGYGWTLTKGDGERRTYAHYGERIHQKKHRDGEETFRLVGIRRPNGNRIHYHYDGNGEVSSIVATNDEGSVVFGWANIVTSWPSKTTKHVTITTSDGQTCLYVYNFRRQVVRGSNIKAYLLEQIHYPDGRVEQLGYEYQKSSVPPFAVEAASDGEGRRQGIEYYQVDDSDLFAAPYYAPNRTDPRAGRVRREMRPVGIDDTLHPAVQYAYGFEKRGFTVSDCYYTDVYDAGLNRTRYTLDGYGRTIDVICYAGATTNRIERLLWKSGYLEGRDISDGEGSVLLSHRYRYDLRGNVVEEHLSGEEIEASVRKLAYSRDGYNLPVYEETGQSRAYYHYQPNTNLLIAKLVYEGDELRERFFYAYDRNAQQVLAIEDDGSDPELESLAGVTYRRIIRTENTPEGLPQVREERYLEEGKERRLSRTRYTYGEANQVIFEDVEGADGSLAYTIAREYDRGGRLIREVGPGLAEECFIYDLHGNLIQQWCPLSTHHTHHTYDFSNRRIHTTQLDHFGTSLGLNYRYDLLGQVIEKIDLCGNSTWFEYDPCGNVAEEVQPFMRTPDGWIEPVIHRSYDSLDRLVEETDARGYITRRTYNARGEVTAVHYPDGTSETSLYDRAGRLVEQTARNGARTTYKRDYRDRPTSIDVYSSGGEHLSHRETHYKGELKVAEIDGNGVETRYIYDGAGRLIEEVQADRRRSLTYDVFGRKGSEREWYGNGADDYTATLWEYDSQGRVVREEITDSSDTTHSRSEYAYDMDGNLRREVSWNSATQANVRTTQYDLLGNPISSTNALGQVTTIRYDHNATLEEHPVLLKTTIDPAGNQTLSYHDPRGNVLRVEKLDPMGTLVLQTDSYFDLSGNRVSEVHRVLALDRPERTVENRWEYDPVGHLRMQTEGVGSDTVRVTRFRYNADGELSELRRPDGTLLIYTYDALGRITKRTGPNLNDRYTYDGNDNILSVTSNVGTTTRTYDPCNRLLSETLANGLHLSYTYDFQGRRTRLILPDQSSVVYTYDAVNLRSVTRHDAQNTPIYSHLYTTYDLEGNICDEQLPGTAGTITTTYDKLGRITSISTTPLEQIQITYDEAGNLTGYLLNDTPSTFTYDSLLQLTAETGVESHTYTHDSLHNRVVHDESDWEVDALNQLRATSSETLTYDPQGCLLTRPNTTYTYDGLNRLLTVETATHLITLTYDPFDRRLTKQTQIRNGDSWQTLAHHRYLYDNRMEIGAIDADDSLIEFRALGIGHGAEIGAAISIELDGTSYLPIHDHRGSVSTLLDLNGTPHATYAYTAFGSCLTSSTLPNPYRFCSKRYDPETKLTNFGRRYYDPTLGRWLTPDPKGYEESSNLYVYVLNAPLSRCDLWGELSLTFEGRAKHVTAATVMRHGGTATVGSGTQLASIKLLDESNLKERVIRQSCALKGQPYTPDEYQQLTSSNVSPPLFQWRADL